MQVGGVDEQLAFTGTGFSYAGGVVSGGTVTGLVDSYMGAPNFAISGFAIAATSFMTWASTPGQRRGEGRDLPPARTS